MTDISFSDPTLMPKPRGGAGACADLSFSFMNSSVMGPPSAPQHHHTTALPDISFQQSHLFPELPLVDVQTSMEEIDELEQASSIPKSSLELEIERIQGEKRALLRYKKKQQRLYQKIREEHQARVIQ